MEGDGGGGGGASRAQVGLSSTPVTGRATVRCHPIRAVRVAAPNTPSALSPSWAWARRTELVLWPGHTMEYGDVGAASRPGQAVSCGPV